jgi:UDP-N-acetylglucosamine--N-acetylmuramyl-(pentapeptide) pyrophosphoryl-undecaprenol N-acetylglucosamine transferase
MVMAGGTGGHIFPALAVAEELRLRGFDPFWLGSRGGFEERIVPDAGFHAEWISISGLRGKGLVQRMMAPLTILRAMFQVLRILLRNRPDLVLGMGGFVTGPGGVMARLLRIPLVIHEQNSIPGMTNRWLSHIATRVLEAFPGSFGGGSGVQTIGNPVGSEIAGLAPPAERMAEREGQPRLLILGGSQGAQALNEVAPAALALLKREQRPLVRHQAGGEKLEMTKSEYIAAGVEATVDPFIKDMASAYGWADLVLCRAGALTISELAAAGVGSILVPYPHAVDDHQTRNGAYLVSAGAAQLLPQERLTAERLATLLQPLLSDREGLLSMAEAAHRLARTEATGMAADVCEEVLRA